MLQLALDNVLRSFVLSIVWLALVVVGVLSWRSFALRRGRPAPNPMDGWLGVATPLIICVGFLFVISSPGQRGEIVTAFAGVLLGAAFCFCYSFWFRTQSGVPSRGDRVLGTFIFATSLVVVSAISVRHWVRADQNSRFAGTIATVNKTIEHDASFDEGATPTPLLYPDETLFIMDVRSVESPPAFSVAAHGHLPIPHSATEVRHVVAVVGRTHVLRNYVSGGEDRSWTFRCWILDVQERTIIDHRVFSGDLPRNRAGAPASPGPSFGSEPWAEVDAWIRSWSQ